MTSGAEYVITADYVKEDGRWTATVSTSSKLFDFSAEITKNDIFDVMFAVSDIRELAEQYVGERVTVVHTVEGSVERWNSIITGETN